VRMGKGRARAKARRRRTGQRSRFPTSAARMDVHGRNWDRSLSAKGFNAIQRHGRDGRLRYGIIEIEIADVTVTITLTFSALDRTRHGFLRFLSLLSLVILIISRDKFS
jgi:hypothetical protein